MFLKKHLPKKGSILDAGGGPGRYTIELAKQGYNVTLLDLVPELLVEAKKQIKKAQVKVNDVLQGSIIDLSRFKDNSFDAVVCLGGPLSHINPESKRKKAISELVRVAKPNAAIFVSAMGKFGVLLATLDGWPAETELKKHFGKIAFEGNDYKWCGQDGFCHFFTLDEFKGLFPKNVEIIETVGLEGLNPSKEITNNFAKKYPNGWKNWLEIHHKLCTHPSVVDVSGHMMIIVNKKFS